MLTFLEIRKHGQYCYPHGTFFSAFSRHGPPRAPPPPSHHPPPRRPPPPPRPPLNRTLKTFLSVNFDGNWYV